MNIENLRKELEHGDTFTYKNLCEVLEEKPKTGNSKPKQLEDWNRYFEYEKDGTKIKILNIRDKVLPDINKMLGRSKYYSDMETLILYALNETKNKNYLVLSVSKALKFTNMVNQNYFIINGNESAFCKQYDIDIDFLHAFKTLSRKKIKDIFLNTLKTMENKSLITQKEITMICEEKILNRYVTEDGDIVNETRRVFRKATIEEESLITKAGEKALSTLNIKTKRDCVVKGKWDTYMNLTMKYLQMDLKNVVFFYKAYEIISHKDIVERKIKEIEKINAEISLNNKSCKMMVNSNNKLIGDKEMRSSLVDILINSETIIDVKSDLIKAKEVSEMTNYDNFID